MAVPRLAEKQNKGMYTISISVWFLQPLCG